MKKREFIRQIRRAAEASGLTFEQLRDRGDHEVWSIGGLRLPIPRHNEISDRLVAGIRSDLEATFGPRWWEK